MISPSPVIASPNVKRARAIRYLRTKSINQERARKGEIMIGQRGKLTEQTTNHRAARHVSRQLAVVAASILLITIFVIIACSAREGVGQPSNAQAQSAASGDWKAVEQAL